MKLIETKIRNLYIIEPRVFEDDRGYFFESYNQRAFDEMLACKDGNYNKYKFIQDNESKSSYGVIRGLHYQLAPYSQAKLVRVIQGTVYDVAVDLRKGSPTFGEWVGVELSGENKKQFLIPKGFAHGFSVLSESVVFTYKCDEFYNPKAERGIIWNDSTLGIDWGIEENDVVVSEKDNQMASFEEAEMNFTY